MPILFLQNITGFMVGTRYEQGGIIKDGAKLINAVSNSTVPHLTLMVGASYGAGNYGMSGRAYDPRFVFTWPNHRIAVMGPKQLAGVLTIVARQKTEAAGLPFDEEQFAPIRDAFEAQVETESTALYATGHLWDDGIIDPRRHPHGARHRAVGDALGAGAGRHLLRRLPDVSADAPAACRPPHPAARRQPRRDRPPGLPHRARARHRPRSRSTPTRTPARRSSGRPTPPSGCPGPARPRPTSTRPRSSRPRTAPGADAVHPGYGFLAENADFAQAVLDAGLMWVGPTPASIRAMGSKVAAKRLAAEAGVPLAPSAELTADDPAAWAVAGAEVGFPLLVKASAGGGGKGMRLVATADDLVDAIAGARREAASAFGDPTVFLERYLAGARHVEVQVFGDTHGTVIHLFERECSIQRRHQKIVEESPSPGTTPATLARMLEAAVALARAVDYVGAGTVEFLVAGAARRRSSSSWR